MKNYKILAANQLILNNLFSNFKKNIKDFFVKFASFDYKI